MTGRMPSRIILRVVVGREPVSLQNSSNVTERDACVVTMRCAAFLRVVMPCGIACYEYARRTVLRAVTVMASIYLMGWELTGCRLFARLTRRKNDSGAAT